MPMKPRIVRSVVRNRRGGVGHMYPCKAKTALYPTISIIRAVSDIGVKSLVWMKRKGPGTSLFCGPAARIPILQGRPYVLARKLRLMAQGGDIEFRCQPVFHAHFAGDGHGIDVVADAAFD